MLVGDGLAGKTRVAAFLLNAQGDNHPDVAITNRRMGIGCSRLQLHSAHGGAIDAQVWGFAGQQVSYLSHTQRFSARRCLHQESLAIVCLHSACFSQKAHAPFKMRCGAACASLGVVIVCLTRRHLTRPKCLKELQWALHLSDQKMLSVIFLPLHPACTYDGVASLLKHKVVYVSQKNDADCCLFALREVALGLLQRYQSEHIGDQKATSSSGRR